MPEHAGTGADWLKSQNGAGSPAGNGSDMNLDLVDVVLFGAVALIGLFWWRSQAVKELALQATRNHCASMGVQLLDDSVVLRGFWFKRNSHGELCVRRSYLFEFTSTGDERYHGGTVMLGTRVETIQLAPHRLN